MKSLSVILLCSVVFLCLVQVGAALTYEGQITTSPSQVSSLKPGDIVSEVSGTIRLPSSGDQTFATKDTLEFYTQLDKAQWSISIVAGVENPARTFGGKHVSIGGWELAYPLDNYEEGVKVKFSLTGGVVPSSFTSGDIILVRVLELDSQSSQVGSAVFKNGTVINTAALQTQLDSVKAKLADLKVEIDAKNALGVDTTVAQQKYDTASSSLDTAAVTLISSPAEVNNLLTTATNNINEASVALDQAWADQSIKKAEAMINSVNGLINEFKVNRSLKESDTRLVPIINKYDLAARTLSSAKNLFDQNSYNAVRSDAAQSLGYANEAWNLSLSLKGELDQGFSLPNLGAFLPFLVVVAVVLIIAGVIIYRKKTQWDELG